MGYVHQGVASVVCWQALINYEKKTIKTILSYIIFASLIHLSALVFLFLLIPASKNKICNQFFFKKLIYFLPYVIIFVVLSIHFFNLNPYQDLFESITIKFFYYLMDDYYKSDGAILRIFLFIPVFILYLMSI